MYNVGDLIIYSSHGVCRIDEVSVKTILGVSKYYYDLHPISNSNLKISTPVDNKSVVMLALMDRDEAEEMIASFHKPGDEWIGNNNMRNQSYSSRINTGKRTEIASIVNTLMRRKHQAELSGKKLGAHDQALLTSIQSILFSELAISLGTTCEDIESRVTAIITEEESQIAAL